MSLPTAKIFVTGGSQAVRLPAEFRFEDVTEVHIRRDESTGDVILSKSSPVDWRSFMQMRDQSGPIPDDFTAERDQAEQLRDPFESWTE